MNWFVFTSGGVEHSMPADQIIGVEPYQTGHALPSAGPLAGIAALRGSLVAILPPNALGETVAPPQRLVLVQTTKGNVGVCAEQVRGVVDGNARGEAAELDATVIGRIASSG